MKANTSLIHQERRSLCTLTHLHAHMATLANDAILQTDWDHHESPLVRIELFSQMICFSVKHPFPRSKAQIGCAIIGIKKALKQLSLAEMIENDSNLSSPPLKSLRPKKQPISDLKQLMSQPLAQKALPHLYEALSFIAKDDQEEIFDLLQLKLYPKDFKLQCGGK